MPDTPQIVTRFAPSPTGHLHIGGARTALFCWALARGAGGRFLLRIEDTDAKRSTEESARGILEDLAWLGIAWDEGPTLPAQAGLGTHTSLGGDPRGVGPWYQSQRLDIYNRLIEDLIERDLAYPAFDTAEELEAMRSAASAAKRTFRYQRAAGYDRAAMLARMRAGEEHVVRFRITRTDIRVSDRVLGEIEFGEEHIDDFVIRKRDGMPTYHFAVVVDDELMGVTHVLRGQEHLNNTPRHVALQRALRHADGRGFSTPVYAHMPLIFNVDGTKMSKRDKDKALKKAVKDRGVGFGSVGPAVGGEGLTQARFESWLGDKASQLEPGVLGSMARAIGVSLPEIEVEDFRAAGYLPETVCNFIALLGWSTGMKDAQGRDVERFGADPLGFLAQHFSMERIGKTNSKFDREKLLSFNMEALTTMEPSAYAERLRAWCGQYAAGLAGLGAERFGLFARAVQPQSKTLREAAERGRFILERPERYDEKAVSKVLRKAVGGEGGGGPTGLELLQEVGAALAGAGLAMPGAWTAAGIHAALEAFCAARGLDNMGRVAQPLRVALTGTTVSPAMELTLAVLGREESLARVSACVAAVAG